MGCGKFQVLFVGSRLHHGKRPHPTTVVAVHEGNQSLANPIVLGAATLLFHRRAAVDQISSPPPEEQEEAGPPNPEAFHQLLETLGGIPFQGGRRALAGQGMRRWQSISLKGRG